MLDNATDISGKLSLAGGTMTGTLDMGTQLMSHLQDPASDQDAATRKYVLDNATDISGKLDLDGSNAMTETLNTNNISNIINVTLYGLVTQSTTWVVLRNIIKKTTCLLFSQDGDFVSKTRISFHT